MTQRYLIALGSNRPHPRHGPPARVLRAALAALDREGLLVEAASAIIASAPLGHSQRRYANAAAIVLSRCQPDELLAHLKGVERSFGRKRGGRRWGSRVLDLDIVLWEAGSWSSPGLTVPHTSFRHRAFVLTPAAAIAPRWRDPVTRLTLKQLQSRLTRPRPLPRCTPR